MRDWICTNGRTDTWAYVEWAQPGKHSHTLYLISVWRGVDDKWWWKIIDVQGTGCHARRSIAMKDAVITLDALEGQKIEWAS